MYNISKAFLEKTAMETGFLRDNLEKVFRLCYILQYLHSDALMSDCLLLKGGTAINLTVFDLPRLSVDIDLDFAQDCDRNEMLRMRAQINAKLLNYMFAQAYALSPNTKNPHSLDSWVFYFQNAAGNRDNIKVEINYSMRSHVLPAEKKRFRVAFLQMDCEIRSLAPLELFGSKIKALIERCASRDLFDVHHMLHSGLIAPDQHELLRKIVIFYLVIGAKKKIEFPMNLDMIQALTFSQIRRSLIPVLRKREGFDLEAAKREVSHYLASLMLPTEAEKQFVEKFYQGMYQPDLLFDEACIIERIKEHPMAIWRTAL